MQRVPRLRMSAVDTVVIWEQWTQGASLSEIGRTLGRVPAAVFHVVRARGRIPPPGRWRAARALTVCEREAISRGLAVGANCFVRGHDLTVTLEYNQLERKSTPTVRVRALSDAGRFLRLCSALAPMTGAADPAVTTRASCSVTLN